MATKKKRATPKRAPRKPRVRQWEANDIDGKLLPARRNKTPYYAGRATAIQFNGRNFIVLAANEDDLRWFYDNCGPENPFGSLAFNPKHVKDAAVIPASVVRSALSASGGQ